MSYLAEFPLGSVKFLHKALTEGKYSLDEAHLALYEVWGHAAGKYFTSPARQPVWDNNYSDRDWET